MQKTAGKILLAPMEGVVDPWIREILTSYGSIDFCVTEFVRVTHQILPDEIFYKYAPELRNGSLTSNGTPVFLQLLGSDLNYMAENAFKASRLGAYGIDINFGCPAKTVNRHDGGSVILKNPERVYQITKAVRDAVPKDIAVNAKVRLGYEHKDFHKEIAQAAESAGAGWLVVHARTKTEGYTPPAHWSFIKSMKEVVKIPVIANGEIWTAHDYTNCRQESECEDVMIGRGLMADPLLAFKISKKSVPPKSFDDHTKDLKTSKILQKFNSLNIDNNFLETNFIIDEFILRYIDICPKKDTSFLVGRTKQLIRLVSRTHLEFQTLFTTIRTHESLNQIIKAILDFKNQ